MEHIKTNRRLLAITALTFVMTVGWVAAILIHGGGDPKLFVVIGSASNFNNRVTSAGGYDGQFGYFIAIKGSAAQPNLDVPTYRYQRILYPLIGGVLGLGQPALVPWTFIAVNIASITIATALLAIWLARLEISPWYAMIFATWVGCFFVIRMDLTELLCMALGFAGLLLIQDGRTKWATLAFALSALTKDMGFVFIGTAGLYLWSTNRRTALQVAILATLPYILWAIFLQLTLVGFKLSTYAGPPLSLIPFSGYLQAKTQIELGLMVLWLIIPTLLIGGLAVYRLNKGGFSLPICFALGAVLWVIYLPGATAYDLVAAYRVAAPIIPAGLLLAAQTEQRRMLWGLSALWLPALLQIFLLPGFFV